MNDQSISKGEIKQLLFFMNRIKVFEKTFVVQKDSITRLIWGLLLVGAGILSFVITQMAYIIEDYGIFSLIPWILAIFSGLVIQIFSDRHITNIYSWKPSDEKVESDTIFMSLAFILIGVVVVITNTPELFIFTFPSISLISGFITLVNDRKYFRENSDILNEKYAYFTPVVCTIIAGLMLIASLIDRSFYIYDSMAFGVGFGGSFSLTAFWNRKKVNAYIEQTDID